MLLAETKGFEPLIPFRGIHTFQACLFNHSSRSPYKIFFNERLSAFYTFSRYAGRLQPSRISG